MKARDASIKEIVAEPPDISIRGAARLSADRRINSVPVLDEGGTPMVSEGDLVDGWREQSDERHAWWLDCLTKAIYSGANPGERCALCRHTVNVGASVCARCGATRRVVGEDLLRVLGQMMMPLSMLSTIIGLMWVGLTGPTYGWFSQLALYGWAILILPPTLAGVLMRLGTEKVKYSRSRSTGPSVQSIDEGVRCTVYDLAARMGSRSSPRKPRSAPSITL